MEFIFEILFQFLGEMLLQLFFEFLVEQGLRSLTDPFQKPRDPVLSTIGIILWSAIAGGISLLVLPKSLITSLGLRKLNLVITPLLAGAIMMLIGRARGRRGQNLVMIDRFGYAFVFAFGMAIVRFIWAT